MANYKTKNRIPRKKLKNPLLKRVIIRFDYTSIANMQEVLNKIVDYLNPPKGYFSTFNQMFLAGDNQIDEGTTIQSNQKMPYVIYRFTGCLIKPEQDVTLDFSRHYICLDIRCDEKYDMIDPYLDLMTEIILRIIGEEPFVQLNRIGIRKIDGVNEISPKEADKTFEYFSQQLKWGSKDCMDSQQYTDHMLCYDIFAYVIYNRIVKYLVDRRKYRFTIDIDCYKESNQLEKRPTEEWLKKELVKMNKKLFAMFLMGIKLDYLNENL